MSRGQAFLAAQRIGHDAILTRDAAVWGAPRCTHSRQDLDQNHKVGTGVLTASPGQNNGHFWYAQGNASANILSNGYGVAQAGHGPDQAFAIVPPQQVYVPRPYPVEVPETRSKFKSKRTCTILLLLVLFIVCGALAAGVAVYEIHKANGTANGTAV